MTPSIRLQTICFGAFLIVILGIFIQFAHIRRFNFISSFSLWYSFTCLWMIIKRMTIVLQLYF